jgi:hypothetical protein
MSASTQYFDKLISFLKHHAEYVELCVFAIEHCASLYATNAPITCTQKILEKLSHHIFTNLSQDSVEYDNVLYKIISLQINLIIIKNKTTNILAEEINTIDDTNIAKIRSYVETLKKLNNKHPDDSRFKSRLFCILSDVAYEFDDMTLSNEILADLESDPRTVECVELAEAYSKAIERNVNFRQPENNEKLKKLLNIVSNLKTLFPQNEKIALNYYKTFSRYIASSVDREKLPMLLNELSFCAYKFKSDLFMNLYAKELAQFSFYDDGKASINLLNRLYKLTVKYPDNESIRAEYERAKELRDIKRGALGKTVHNLTDTDHELFKDLCQVFKSDVDPDADYGT